MSNKIKQNNKDDEEIENKKKRSLSDLESSNSHEGI